VHLCWQARMFLLRCGTTAIVATVTRDQVFLLFLFHYSVLSLDSGNLSISGGAGCQGAKATPMSIVCFLPPHGLPLQDIPGVEPLHELVIRLLAPFY
jgi:hypothetical protein